MPFSFPELVWKSIQSLAHLGGLVVLRFLELAFEKTGLMCLFEQWSRRRSHCCSGSCRLGRCMCAGRAAGGVGVPCILGPTSPSMFSKLVQSQARHSRETGAMPPLVTSFYTVACSKKHMRNGAKMSDLSFGAEYRVAQRNAPFEGLKETPTIYRYLT